MLCRLFCTITTFRTASTEATMLLAEEAELPEGGTKTRLCPCAEK